MHTHVQTAHREALRRPAGGSGLRAENLRDALGAALDGGLRLRPGDEADGERGVRRVYGV